MSHDRLTGAFGRRSSNFEDTVVSVISLLILPAALSCPFHDVFAPIPALLPNAFKVK